MTVSATLSPFEEEEELESEKPITLPPRESIADSKESLVLVEGSSKTNKQLMSGRTDGGKIVNFVGSEDMLGKYVKVKITKAKQWSLEGEIIE